MSYCILDVNNLSIENSEYNIEKINLRINKGQILGLLGPKGSGKSTIIKSILGLIKYNSGEVSVDGMKQENNNEQIKQYIGYVSENASLHKNMSCMDFYKLAKKYYEHWDDILFSSLLEEFDFDLSKEIGDLSRGNLVKFLCILSISHHPKLLILDEMPEDINPLVKNHIYQRIKMFVKEEGCCALISSDKSNDLYKISDIVSYIHMGKIIMTGNKKSLLTINEEKLNETLSY